MAGSKDCEDGKGWECVECRAARTGKQDDNKEYEKNERCLCIVERSGL